VAVLLVLSLAAMVAFAAVGHLVNRFNANQKARGHALYLQGLSDVSTGKLEAAVEKFRAALTCDPANSQYQLSLGRALRDTGHLDEAESYLLALWQRAPQDGTINLALGRVAARRGSVDDAIRYYHNAMYGVWSADADANRRKARVELIEFLLQKGARAEAQSELVALAASLPPDPQLHLQAAQFFAQAQDYRDAISEYEQVLRTNRGDGVALAGAGEAAYHAGHYRTAQRYLQEALKNNPQDLHSRQLLESTTAVMQTDPFVRRISDAERVRRLRSAFLYAGDRLKSCAGAKGINVEGTSAGAGSSTSSLTSSSSTALATLYQRWSGMKADLRRLRTAGESDLPDTIMDLVFQIEQQTANDCGEPKGADQALLLLSHNREGADQ
jgi:tetratricopeptide (TPR) repeat protein